MVEAYTDGGFSIPKNKGAWAVVIVEDGKIVHEERGELKNETSNRMELYGFIRALELISKFRIENIHSDSTYIVNGYNKWMEGWNRSNWKKANKKKLKNSDLWEKVYALRNTPVLVKWVKAHSGMIWNERVDELTKV